tara:strand:- start:202 stop:2073 length:1872 start_codon:yes stop_codon:yes gene_type:complete
MTNNYKKININIFIFVITLSLFSFKWIISYHFFKDDISLKIIFDTPGDGFFYYIYSEALSNFNFNPSYDNEVNSLKNLPIPFYSVLIPSILFLIFGNFSILILEFICIYFFYYIFYLILQKFNFSNLYILLLSTIIFCIPSFIQYFNLSNISYSSAIYEIYNLRFPRPLIVNLFFFIYILFFLNLNSKNVFNFKNFIILSIILSISFSSFYYFFIVEAISFIIFIYIYYGLKEMVRISNMKYYIVSIFSFLILSVPFIFFLYSSEIDYKERLYLIDLDFDKKIILLKYLSEKVFSLKFIFIFSFLSLLNYYSNRTKTTNYNLINKVFIIFLSSVVAPFLFIIASTQTGLVYHFTNLIVFSAFIYLFIYFANMIHNFNINSLNLVKYLSFVSVLTLIFFNNFYYYDFFKKKNLNENYLSYREGIMNSSNLMKRMNKNNINLLTFSPELMVWSTMNGVGNIVPLSGQLVSKKHETIENDLIHTFKFLNLNKDLFLDFFKNKNYQWRLFNSNTQLFFWGRYSASKLKTINDSVNFKTEELEVINKTTPLNVQSIAIPLEEFDRLGNKFENLKKNKIFRPSIIVLNNDKILMQSDISKIYYSECINLSTSNIKIFILNEFLNLCQEF